MGKKWFHLKIALLTLISIGSLSIGQRWMLNAHWPIFLMEFLGKEPPGSNKLVSTKPQRWKRHTVKMPYVKFMHFLWQNQSLIRLRQFWFDRLDLIAIFCVRRDSASSFGEPVWIWMMITYSLKYSFFSMSFMHGNSLESHSLRLYLFLKFSKLHHDAI